MWARKAKTVCHGEDDGIPTEVEYVHLEESWYEVLGEGLGAFLLMLWMAFVVAFCTPAIAIRQAIRQARYCDAVVPKSEVRERAHLG